MKSLQLIILMVDNDIVYSENGIPLLKPISDTCGEPFFFWTVRSITKYIECAGITFVVREEIANEFNVDYEIKKCFPEARITVVSETNEGEAVAALKGVEGIDNCEPVLFMIWNLVIRSVEFNDYCKNITSAISVRIPGALPVSGLRCGITSGEDGALITCEGNSDDKNIFRHKDEHSAGADILLGHFYFRSRAVFESACADSLMNSAEGCAVSDVYNMLAESGGKVRKFRADFSFHFEEVKNCSEAAKSIIVEGCKELL